MADKVGITPEVGMNFESEEEAFEMYNTYAGKVGFSVRNITHIPIPCIAMHAAALPSHARRCARSQASEPFGAARSFPDTRPSDFPAPPRVDRVEGWAPDALCIWAAPNFVPLSFHRLHYILSSTRKQQGQLRRC